MPSTDFKPQYVYTIIIDAPAQKIWDALTHGEHTQHFWAGFKVSSDWKKGSLVQFHAPSGKMMHDGHVLEIDPPNKLTMTMKSDPEPPSVFTYELSDFHGATKLRVLHGELATQDDIDAISGGWPNILSLLKTYVERGEPMPAAERWKNSRNF